MTSGYSLNNISTFVFNENLNINPTKRVQECELEELVKHGLRALRDTLPNEVVTYNTAHDADTGLRQIPCPMRSVSQAVALAELQYFQFDRMTNCYTFSGRSDQQEREHCHCWEGSSLHRL